MNTDFLINGVLSSVLGGRRRRSRRALRYLTGGGSSFLSSPTALLTAAGLAWGIVESLQGQSGPAEPALGGPIGGAGGTGASSSTPTLPPLPVMSPAGAATAPAAIDDAQRVVRLAVAAAYADGAMSDEERQAIVQQAQAAGVGQVVDEELERRRPLAEIVAGVTDTAQRATLYVLAFTIVRADEQVSGADRIFLAQLAHLLGLDPATVTRLEDDTTRRIDAEDQASASSTPA
jgi:tellurite resistance protein